MKRAVFMRLKIFQDKRVELKIIHDFFRFNLNYFICIAPLDEHLQEAACIANCDLSAP